MAETGGIEGEAGIVPVDLNLNLGDIGSARADSSASGSVNLKIGDRYNSSGNGGAIGKFGIVKLVAFGVLALAGYAVYLYFGKGGRK